MIDKTLTLESMQEIKGALDKSHRESLRWLTGMNIVKSEYLPTGTVMVMVSEDVYKTVCAMQDETEALKRKHFPFNESNPIFVPSA